MRTLVEIFLVSFRLGCTSFGGPTAHLGYFQQTYVKEKKWLTDEEYADLIALSQFLPGPTSSQVGIGVGLIRGGMLGSIVSFTGFTMPSVLLLMLFAAFYLKGEVNMGWIQGLKLVAVAVVGQAIVDMAKKLLIGWRHTLLAILACAAGLILTTPWTQAAVILIAGIAGYLTLTGTTKCVTNKQLLSKKTGAVLLFIFFALLFVLPLANHFFTIKALVLFEKFYIAGALVFGGGHVVLPLLETHFVSSGIMSMESFLTGYGATQAVPGPLFTFAAYIGMILGGIGGALWATFAIFLPGFLLILGALPFWLYFSGHQKMRGAIAGMNAAVVGILTAAFFTPIISDSISGAIDAVFIILFFVLLIKWKMKASTMVLLGILVGIIWY